MGSFLALVIIILIALLIVKVGSSALELTGMTRHVARFQAASAFFGVGFTTREAEQVVNHPVRRKVILYLIVAGNIGLTTVLATLLVTLVKSYETGLGKTYIWLGIIVLGALVLGLFLNFHVVANPLDRFLQSLLQKAGIERLIDYDYLLNLQNGFCVYDGEIGDDHPWLGKELREVKPAEDGLIVLGIYRGNGDFVGAPKRNTVIEKGDVLMVYGQEKDVHQIFNS